LICFHSASSQAYSAFYQYNQHQALVCLRRFIMLFARTMKTDKLDLIFLPIVRQPEHDEGIVPGLFTAVPPRRVARGRAEDILFLRLALGGNAVMEAAEQTHLLEKASQHYYKNSGAVTGAIRELVVYLNQEILNRNLHNAGRGLQTIGYLTVGVLRPDRLYVALCGPTHAFLVTQQGAEHLFDPELAGRGLGLARTTPVRYMQFNLQAGDLILLTVQPSPAWSPEFLHARRAYPLEALRRELIAQIEIDPFAVLVQARPGEGRLRIARPKPVGVVQDQAATFQAGEAEVQKPAPTAQAEVASVQPGPTPQPSGPPITLGSSAHPPETTQESKPQSPPAILPSHPHAEESGRQPDAAVVPDSAALSDVESGSAGETVREESPVLHGAEVPAGEVPVTPASQPPKTIKSESAEKQKTKPKHPQVQGDLRSRVFSSVRAIDRRLAQMRLSLRTGLQRLLPDESLSNIPPSVMLFTAVAIPLIMVAIAWTMYAQRGRESVYDDYVNQAVAIASQAQEITDPDELRQIYSDALAALDRAEEERVTEQSTAYRAQIQQEYDQLEWIQRLDYQPAIFGGLDSSVVISRIVAIDEDLYLLNATTGGVLHAVQTERGYEIDPAFICGSGANNGALVDIVALPRENNFDAKIMGVDANGNLLYCLPGGPPVPKPLPPSDSGWGRVEAIRPDSGILYVLDPPKNAVWYYPGTESLFNELPGFFFGEDVPNLINTVDLEVNLTDLYLLHENGEISFCIYSNLEVSSTRCEKPAEFTDPRPGRGIGPQIEGTTFSQILYSQPPEPSIYLLEPATQSVYHFSVRLTFQRQYRPRTPLAGGEATAFTLAPTRRIFLAVGSQLYYAVIP
jgi:hypothetical protein